MLNLLGRMGEPNGQGVIGKLNSKWQPGKLRQFLKWNGKPRGCLLALTATDTTTEVASHQCNEYSDSRPLYLEAY